MLIVTIIYGVLCVICFICIILNNLLNKFYEAEIIIASSLQMRIRNERLNDFLRLCHE